MRAKRITTERIAAFVRFLQQEERSSGTIENYLRDVRQFAAWMHRGGVNKEKVAQWNG